MKKNILKSGLLTIAILVLLLAFTGVALAVHDVTVARTIVPETICPGDYFDVTVDIYIEGGESFLGVLREEYTDYENMQSWEISNINTDSVFVDYKDGVAGIYDWSGGMSAIPEGTYQISYRITIPENEEPGTYQINGQWADVDHPDGVGVSGSKEIILNTNQEADGDVGMQQKQPSVYHTQSQSEEDSRENNGKDIGSIVEVTVSEEEVKHASSSEKEVNPEDMATQQEPGTPGFTGLTTAFSILLTLMVQTMKKRST